MTRLCFILIGLMPNFILAQDNVGINTISPQFTLDIRGAAPDLGGNLQLGNQDANHFLRLFPGHDLDPKPFLLFNKSDTFRIATSGPDFSDFTERLTVKPDGDVGIGINAPANRLQVHDPDVYTVGEPPFVFTFGDANRVQITNGVSGTDTTDELILGVGQGGQGEIHHPLLVSVQGGDAKMDLFNTNGDATVKVDSHLVVSEKMTIQGLSGPGDRLLVASPTGLIATTTIDSADVFSHARGFSNSTAWSVPAGVTRLKAELWGAGGGGASGGGGSAGSFLQGYLDVTPGETITINIGSAGVGSASAGGDSGNGGNTSVTGNLGTYTAFGGNGASSSGPGGDNPGGSASGSLTEFFVFPGSFGRANAISWDQTSSTDFVKIIGYGDGGNTFRFPASGGAGRVRVENASNGNLIEYGNGKIGKRPGGGGGGSDFGYNGGPGYMILYW